MKNYYKVLNVRETATEEEIRNHWVELTKRYHPDQAAKESLNGDRIREINEAYEILKFSSSRVKYDLQRAYEKRKKREVFRRIMLRKSYLLLIPLVFGLIYFSLREFPVSPPSNPPRTPVKDAVPAKESTKPPREASQDGENVRFKGRPSPDNPLPVAGIGEANDRKTEISKAISKEDPGAVSAGQPGKIKKDGSQRIAKVEGVSSKIEPVMAPRPAPRPESPKPAKTESKDSIETPIEQPPPLPEPVTVSAQRSDDPTTGRLADNGMTGEEEVKRFFDSYVERYTLMDLNGFLTFFSSLAIQNRTDDINEIRRVYTQFFNQSQSLVYQLKNPAIKIFPDSVQVKAFYEVKQKLKTGATRLWKGRIEWDLVREEGALKISSIEYRHDRSP
jgi:curved DNA-binding protein CbpA